MKTFEEVFDKILEQGLYLFTVNNLGATSVYVSEDVYEIIYNWFISNRFFYSEELREVPMLNGLNIYVVKNITNHLKVC